MCVHKGVEIDSENVFKRFDNTGHQRIGYYLSLIHYIKAISVFFSSLFILYLYCITLSCGSYYLNMKIS